MTNQHITSWSVKQRLLLRQEWAHRCCEISLLAVFSANACPKGASDAMMVVISLMTASLPRGEGEGLPIHEER
jgi:hypothetical protein